MEVKVDKMLRYQKRLLDTARDTNLVDELQGRKARFMLRIWVGKM